MARTIGPDGGPTADSPAAPDMLADALVRHMFALSMELHRILGRISAPAGRTGQPHSAAEATHPADQSSAHPHPDSEQLCRILHEAITELDQMVHRTRALVLAHPDGTTPAEPNAV